MQAQQQVPRNHLGQIFATTRGRSSTPSQGRRGGTRTTYLAIVPRHIRICQHLREHGAVARRAVHRRAIAGEPESLAEEDEVGGSLFGRREREELADLKGGVAERARVIRKDFVCEQPFDLCYCGLQEIFIGRARWEGVGVLRIILRGCENRVGIACSRERPNAKGGTRRTWGIFFGSVSPGG